MTSNLKATKTAVTFEFGDEVVFINNYGQRGYARVMWQDGETLSVDYLGCQHEITLSQLI